MSAASLERFQRLEEEESQERQRGRPLAEKTVTRGLAGMLELSTGP